MARRRGLGGLFATVGRLPNLPILPILPILIFLILLGSLPAGVAAQAPGWVVPPGREGVIREAVMAGTGEAPVESVSIMQNAIRVDTGTGVTLVATSVDGVEVALSCEAACDRQTRAEWAPVAARLRASLAAREGEIWVSPIEGRPQETVDDGQAYPKEASWLLLVLVVVGLLAAPGRRGPASPATLGVALLGVAAFVVAALAISPPRPLHDHLCFVERAYCASTLACDVVHHAWGRPSFHLMGLFLSATPHRLPFILGLGVALTAVALFFIFDVTARVAARIEHGARAGEAGLIAVAVVAVHPGFLRLAGAGSFWPLTMVLLFIAFHLVLRAAEGRGVRAGIALFAAGAAFALALGGNRIVLVLGPLMVLAPWVWRGKGRGKVLRPVQRAVPFAALVLPVAMFASGAWAVLRGGAYGGVREPTAAHFIAAFSGVATDGALDFAFTTPLVLALAIVGVASKRRLGQGAPLLYAFVAVAAATLYVAGPLAFIAQFPDHYLKHFAQLFLVAPLCGLGAVVAADFVAARSKGGALFVLPVVFAALVVGAWSLPEARRLLFAERVVERELVALESAFPALPAHDELVVVQLAVPLPGMDLVGDPLEVHFPVGLYRAALIDGGLTPGRVTGHEELAARSRLGGRVLFYLGSTLRTFYGSEIASGRVPDDLERPQLRELRERFDLEPVHLFRLSTDEPSGAGNVVAPGRSEVELGFYWLRERGGEG